MQQPNSQSCRCDQLVYRHAKKGFKIKQVGHDRKFCREYFLGMKQAGFKILDQPQYFYKKSEGFRYIEDRAKMENFIISIRKHTNTAYRM